MKKCEYCAKEISYHEQYCSIDCHAEANKYYEKCEKFGKLFSIINGICVFGIPIGLFVSTFLRLPGTIIALVSCVVLGIMLIDLLLMLHLYPLYHLVFYYIGLMVLRDLLLLLLNLYLHLIYMI